MSFSKDEIDICERALSLKIKNDGSYERFLSKLSHGSLLRLEVIFIKYEENLKERGS